MSDVLTVIVSFTSLVVSVASLLFTVAAYRRLDDEASETFAVIGADEGNHEARLERLENKVGLQVIPSPSALDVEFHPGGDFNDEFACGQEDAELRADHDSATNEGMANHD